mmetsp:Transcript_168158/g.540164  ORF Transcript_168158/g.540164 Transcript_168158/m.540164 type:complete len:445 (-) Transcript_168158:116-1450(-)
MLNSFALPPETGQLARGAAAPASAAQLPPTAPSALPRLRGSDTRQGGEALASAFGRGLSASTAAAVALSAVALGAERRRRKPASRRETVVPRRVFNRDLTLNGYPVHGPGFYWTLSKDTEAVIVYMPIADDVTSKDIVFSCKEWALQFGCNDEKGGMVLDDRVLYKVDSEESYYVLDKGMYDEKCAVLWLYKYSKEQNWYAYDRFVPATERFLMEGEKERANLQYMITSKCFLDITIDAKPVGRIVVGLWGELCPKTTENFRCLCTGEKGTSKETVHALHFKGTYFHRVVKDFCIQGGQTWENDEGSGGESIYGATFEDENLRVQFNKPGILAMANAGPDTNGSQFFVTVVRAEHLNFRTVGFGEVLEGMDVVKQIESLGNADGDVVADAMIADSGELSMEGDAFESGGFYKVPSARELDQSTELRDDMMRKVIAKGGRLADIA